jgi:WD40 repeat protein
MSHINANMHERNPAIHTGTWAPAPEAERGYNLHFDATRNKGYFMYTNNRTVFLRELKDPTQVRIYSDHKCKATVAKFSPRGNHACSGDAEGNVIIWEILSNRFNIRKTFPINSGVKDIAWSPDNRRVIVSGSSSGNQFSKVIMIDSGNTVGVIQGHDGTTLSCDYRPVRPYRAVTGGEDRCVAFHQGPPFKFMKSFKEFTNFVQCVRYSPDGNTIAAVGNDIKKIALFDGKTGDHLKNIKMGRKTGHKGTIYSCSWSPDGKELLTSSADKTCKVWGEVDGKWKCTKTFRFGEDLKRPALGDMQVSCLWHEDTMMSISLNGAINFLNPETPDVHNSLHGCQSNIKALVVDAENGKVYTGELNGKVTSWDIKTNLGTWFGGKAHDTMVCSLVVNGGKLQVFSNDDKFRSYDIASLTSSDDKKQAPVATGGAVVAIAQANTDLNTTALILAQQKIVLITDNKVATTVDLKYQPLCIAFSPDDKTLYVGGKNSLVKVYDVDITSGAITETESEYEGEDWVLHVCPNPDGQTLVVVDKKRSILHFDVATAALRNYDDPLTFHRGTIAGAAWSPDGSKLVTVAADSNIIVWYDGHSGHRLLWEGHCQAIAKVAWIDNTTLVTAGDERALKTWTVPAVWE